MASRLSSPREVFLFLAAALVASCGTSSAAPEESSTGALTRTAFAAQYCALVKPCCDGAGLPAAGCANGVVPTLPPRFDSDAGQACLDAVRAASSSLTFCDGPEVHLGTRACTLLSSERGTLPVGGTCNIQKQGGDCARSPEGQVGCVFSGDGRSSPAPTVCALQLLGGEGATPCVGDSQPDGLIAAGASLDVARFPKAYTCDRSKGLHCRRPVGSTSGGICGKASAVGEPCEHNDYECESGAYCRPPTMGGYGTCAPRLAVGADCPSGVGCVAGAYCLPDLTTVNGYGRCTAYLANGAACKQDGILCASLFCTKDGSCASGFPGADGTALCKP